MSRVRIVDAQFSRMLLNETLRDVRKVRPGIKTSAAKFTLTRMTNAHGQRWMQFEFEGVRRDGYYWNAFDGRIAGWNAWLREKGYEK
jgi:hypothetical protein